MCIVSGVSAGSTSSDTVSTLLSQGRGWAAVTKLETLVMANHATLADKAMLGVLLAAASEVCTNEHRSFRLELSRRARVVLDELVRVAKDDGAECDQRGYAALMGVQISMMLAETNLAVSIANEVSHTCDAETDVFDGKLVADEINAWNPVERIRSWQEYFRAGRGGVR